MGASALATWIAVGAAAQEAPTPTESIVVTGTRLGATGFNAPTPITVVSSSVFESRGATSIYNVTKDIPAFRNSAGPDNSNSGVRQAGQAILDLRGLGSSRTLTLIDGVRPVPVSSGGDFDSGLIPVSLIDRIEVVTGGASAAYGSDAVAGAVNVILKRDFEGLSAAVQYAQTERGDGGEPMVSLGWGGSFADGRGRVMVGGDFVKAYGVGTIYTRDWGKEEPGLLSLPASRPAGLPANIITEHVELTSYTPGGIVTSGPLRGMAFAPGGTPYQFEYGSLAGTSTHIGDSNYGMTAFGTSWLRNRFERQTAMARVEYDLTPAISGYALLHFGSLRSGGDASRQPNPGQYPVLLDNPYLPAATRQAMIDAGLTQITVSRINTEYDPSGSNNHLMAHQAILGAEGPLGASWSWDVSASAGYTDNKFRFDNIPNRANLYASAHVVTGPDGEPVCGPIETNPYFNAQDPISYAQLIATLDDGCAPSNIFGKGSISQEAIDYFLRGAAIDSDIRRYTAAANLRGEPFDLPAGPVSVALGLEWRRDTVDAVSCELCELSGLTATNSESYKGAQSVEEAYVEVGAPLVRDVPFLEALDLNGAARLTSYSLSGEVTTWKVGVTWDVTEFLRLRATRSRDIRAPSIDELYNQGSMGVTNIVNPKTGGTGIVGSKSVGNPNLEPEEADTSVFGVVFTPGGFLDGFRASVDYYDIEVAGVIGTLGAQTILNGYYLQGITQYGQFIVEDNSPIGIQSVSSSLTNLSSRRATGYDVELLYSVPLDALDLPGDFRIRALGTHTTELSTTSASGTLDTAGYVQGRPEWVWNVNFDYALDRLGLGLQSQYATEVGYSNQMIGPDDPSYSPSLPNSINRNRWPESLYFNANVRYDVVDDGSRRVQLYGVVNNLLDKDPPIVAGVFFGGGSPYDTIGRVFKVGARIEY